MRASFRSLTVVALVAVGAAVPAYAQSAATDAPLSTYPACSASKPSQAETDAAHGAYMAGKGSYDESDYTTAINYFKDAYRRDCTKNELLVIIARSYELQGSRREAVHALETYLERAPTAPDADVQKRHIANLKRELADQPAPKPSASAPPAPTTVIVAPSATASAAPVPSATAAPAAAVSTDSPPPHRSSHSAAPWIVVGVGGAALITGAILYGVGAGQVSTSETNCPPPNHTGPKCTASDASSGNSGRTLESAGVVTDVVGLVAVGVGLILHFTESKSPPKQTGKPLVMPQVGPGYAGVGVVGRF